MKIKLANNEPLNVQSGEVTIDIVSYLMDLTKSACKWTDGLIWFDDARW